jgi:hypothetical protein
MSAFSKRHRRALQEGDLQVDLDATTRGRIRRLLEGHNESYRTTDSTGWNYDTDLLEDLTDELGDLYGTSVLPGTTVDRNLKSFLESAPPASVFDAIELFKTLSKDNFTLSLNRVLAEEEVPWRMLDGEMVLIDETFARSELAGRADQSIRQLGFSGATAEMRRARNHIADGDGRAAVHRAGSSFESVLMALLSVDHGTAKNLLQKLNRDGYFDELPVELREQFIKEVLSALPWMRNKLGGHGQGETEVNVPLPYAQLATDLASAFCHFLISLKLERVETSPQAQSESTPAAKSVDDSDFSFTSGSDNDIPF